MIGQKFYAESQILDTKQFYVFGVTSEGIELR